MKASQLMKWLVASFLLLASSAFANDSLTNSAVRLTNKTVNLVKDSSITSYLYAQIALDNSLSQQNINVSTTQGVVFLTGTVATPAQAQAAIKMAQAVAGVTRVESSLKVVNK